jgi:hypothetical protein
VMVIRFRAFDFWPGTAHSVLVESEAGKPCLEPISVPGAA